MQPAGLGQKRHLVIADRAPPNVGGPDDEGRASAWFVYRMPEGLVIEDRFRGKAIPGIAGRSSVNRMALGKETARMPARERMAWKS